MLQKLIIKNIALIDSAEINFTDGLNVLSGETGAGKSVIIESLNFVLGAKADRTLIRSGEAECSVRAEFDVSNNRYLLSIYDEFDLEKEDVLIISRKFTVDGKSSIKINGNTATVGMLKKFTSALVDVHGQSEHFNLLKSSNQLALLDKVGGDEIFNIKSKIKVAYSNYRNILQELDALGGDDSQRLIRLDILNYQINEIEKAELKENEEEELLAIKQKLAHQEKILNALNALKSSVNDEGGISDILGNISKMMSGISDFGKDYSELYDRIESVFSEIDDLADNANELIDDVEVIDYNPDEIESRLEIIKSLKNKYGNTYQDIEDFLRNAKTERERLENFNENAEKLLINKTQAENVLYKYCLELSNLRRDTSNIFAKNIINELSELGMAKATFNINFNDLPSREECEFKSANGIDEVEYLFSANSGEPLKPLSMVISGGEMSRFMLSIKSQTAKYNDISTFIFDEIDSGISGNVAKIVAEKFAKISRDVQIIAITHLPQISAMADNNLLIEKNESNFKTLTSVKTLSAKDKVEEIVRLVGGDVNSDASVKLAEELIENAKNYKLSINNKAEL